VPVKTEVQAFPLEQTNQALDSLRRGQLQGAAVLSINSQFPSKMNVHRKTE
jgi:propanol-preferring alcohol dehydrogenase